MKHSVLLLCILVLAACGKATSADSVDLLVAHPDHLHEVEKQCARQDPQVSAAECEAASEARHRLFYGNGPQYTPPKSSPKF